MGPSSAGKPQSSRLDDPVAAEGAERTVAALMDDWIERSGGVADPWRPSTVALRTKQAKVVKRYPIGRVLLVNLNRRTVDRQLAAWLAHGGVGGKKLSPSTVPTSTPLCVPLSDSSRSMGTSNPRHMRASMKVKSRRVVYEVVRCDSPRINPS
jgi:hypothetical protein